MSNVVAAYPPGRVTNAGLWLLQAGLAFAFAGAGYLKLSGAPAMTATNQFLPAQSPWLPIGLLVVAVVIARGRWRRTTILVSRSWRGARG